MPQLPARRSPHTRDCVAKCARVILVRQGWSPLNPNPLPSCDEPTFWTTEILWSEFPSRRSILCQASRSAGSGWVTRAAPARMIRALMPTLNGSTSHRPRATPSGVTPIPKTCFLRVRNQGRRCVPVRCTTARGPCGHSSADQRMLDAAYRHKMCGDATPLVKLQSGVARRRFLGLVGAALFVGPSPQPGTALPF